MTINYFEMISYVYDESLSSSYIPHESLVLQYIYISSSLIDAVRCTGPPRDAVLVRNVGTRLTNIKSSPCPKRIIILTLVCIQNYENI